MRLCKACGFFTTNDECATCPDCGERTVVTDYAGVKKRRLELKEKNQKASAEANSRKKVLNIKKVIGIIAAWVLVPLISLMNIENLGIGIWIAIAIFAALISFIGMLPFLFPDWTLEMLSESLKRRHGFHSASELDEDVFAMKSNMLLICVIVIDIIAVFAACCVSR